MALIHRSKYTAEVTSSLFTHTPAIDQSATVDGGVKQAEINWFRHCTDQNIHLPNSKSKEQVIFHNIMVDGNNDVHVRKTKTNRKTNY